MRLRPLILVVGLLAPLDRAVAAPVAGPTWGEIVVLGETVDPGRTRRIPLIVSQSFAGDSLETPVAVARGVEPGPTLCVTAGIHGDELNGIEVVRRLVERIEPEELYGTLIAVPIVNLHGFVRSSRYLPDRRDLNRHFPGSATGSAASRIAYALFVSVIRRCDALVDLHTGSFHRSNLPQIRGDLRDRAVAELAVGFASTVVVHHPGSEGTLRRAAGDVGVPTVTYEAGEPMRFRENEVEVGVRGIVSLMHWLDMLPPERRPAETPRQRVYHDSRWVRVNAGGILFSEVALGEPVAAGQRLGVVTDPITNARSEVIAPAHGRIIGMALNQVVIPGFAAFHLGIEGSAFRVVPDPDASIDSDPENEPE